ncbi:MAG: 50S ribosomal protein L28 [Saprospiraceae bacterium]
MARECQLTGKKPMSGHKVSHSNMKSKRRFLPNLQKKSFFIPETGQTVELNVSTSAIRNIDKIGLYDYLIRLKAEGFHTGVTLKKKKK